MLGLYCVELKHENRMFQIFQYALRNCNSSWRHQGRFKVLGCFFPGRSIDPYCPRPHVDPLFLGMPPDVQGATFPRGSAGGATGYRRGSRSAQEVKVKAAWGSGGGVFITSRVGGVSGGSSP